jgi:predicted ATPase
MNYMMLDFRTPTSPPPSPSAALSSSLQTTLQLIGTLHGITHEAFFKQQLQSLQDHISMASKKIWNVPPELKLFVGRQEELASLSRTCQPAQFQQKRKVTVVAGSGGMGKSVLARQFVNRHQDRFQIGWQLNAETMETLIQGMVELARELALFPMEGMTSEKIALKLVERLSSLPELSPWLLVYDNLEYHHADDVFARFIPQQGGLAMVTSRHTLRRQLIDEDGDGEEILLKLGSLKKEEAMELLAKKAKRKRTKEFEKIVQFLDCMPLAVNQV